MDRITVFVYAHDPISQAGLVSQLRGRPTIQLVDDLAVDSAEVAVVSVDRIDEATLRVIRAVQRNGCPRVLLLVTEIDEGGLLHVVEEGVVGLVRRADASPERLEHAIGTARVGGGSLPPDLLGRLLRQVKQVHEHVLAPQGLTFSGLSEREVDVLRLVSEGLDTREIADQLCYSERTIKNVVHEVVRRFGLRNRSHAVAYVLRQGLI
jgi:DNA-binding NarL/FixJ family response regulator